MGGTELDVLPPLIKKISLDQQTSICSLQNQIQNTQELIHIEDNQA